MDDTEDLRKVLVVAVNTNPRTREELEKEYRDVWNTHELGLEFEVTGFAAPLVVVKRKCDGAVGSLYFQHEPRYYFDFQERT